MNIFNIFKSNKSKNEQRSFTPQYLGQPVKKTYIPLSNVHLALGVSTFYRCVDLIAKHISSQSLQYLECNKRGFYNQSNVNNHILHQFNYDFLYNIIFNLYVQGNAYIHLSKNLLLPKLTLLSQKSVFYNINTDEYVVTDSINDISGTFKPSSIIHLKLMAENNKVGNSILDYIKNIIGIYQTAQDENGNTIASGGRLKGIVTADEGQSGFAALQGDQLSDIRNTIEDEIRSGKQIYTLPEGSKFSAISMTMRDLMIQDTLTSCDLSVARFFGVPTQLLGYTNSTYKSTEDALDAFENITIIPILTQLESQLNDKLIASALIDKCKYRFDRSNLSSWNNIVVQGSTSVSNGLKTINEVRKELYLPESNEPNANTLFISQNLKSLSEITDSKQDTKKSIIPEEK